MHLFIETDIRKDAQDKILLLEKERENQPSVVEAL